MTLLAFAAERRVVAIDIYCSPGPQQQTHCTLLQRSIANGPITIAIRARFEYDSTTIRLQHATTRYEVFRALAYEIVYENQW